MTDPVEYGDNLYYVWGFHGLLLIDAESHTEAQESYGYYYKCDVSMIEHCMRVPDPEIWATRWEEPEIGPHECIADDNDDDDSVRCICDPLIPWFPTREVDPKDPRVAWIDLESDKAALEARVDQTLAYQRDKYGDDSAN